MRDLSNPTKQQSISPHPLLSENISKPMLGKVVLITGANSGIGLVTACKLAQQGAHLILLCRNADKGQKAVEQVNQADRNQEAELLLCDLASLASVQTAAQQFIKSHSKLHVLINNAGILPGKKHITIDGYEEAFAVNHLGHFLLTQLLLPLLKASAPARIINLSSIAHLFGRIHWNDLQLEKKYSGYTAYAQSKLANILFTLELAKRLRADRITVNCLHPGTITTNLYQTYLPRLFQKLLPLLPSAETGAETSIYLASSNEVETMTGIYFFKKKPKKLTLFASNEIDAARLWKISEELTKFYTKSNSEDYKTPLLLAK